MSTATSTDPARDPGSGADGNHGTGMDGDPGSDPARHPRSDPARGAADWVSTPILGGPVEVVGAAELEARPDGVVVHRLPAAARAQMPDDFIRMCEEQPSGVRLVLRTAARRLELDVRALRTVPVNPPSGRESPVPAGGRYDVVVDGRVVARGAAVEHGIWALDFGSRVAQVGEAPVATVSFELPRTADEGEQDVEVWLPYAEVTRLVGLRTDAPVRPAAAASRGPRWVHHGSSISHGASAESPTGIWPVVAARRLGLDLVNLGLSGNAVLDPFVARAIRDQPSDLITLKLGINVVNHDCFRRRTFTPAVHGFLDTIRVGHPTTPVVVISPILCPMVEDCPGPTEIDPASPSDAPTFRTLGRPEEPAADKLSLTVIRSELAGVVGRRRASGDRNLHYLDGRELYGVREWDTLPMPDLLHPEARGQRHMGERFAELLPALVPAAVPAP